MSLQKKFVTEKGIEYDYHRLAGINIDYDNNKILVKVKHYSKDVFRSKEKETQKVNRTLSTKHEKLNSLMAVERTEELNNEIIKLSEEINTLSETIVPEEDLALFESVEEFTWSKDLDISQTGIYNLLKQSELYKDSKDI